MWRIWRIDYNMVGMLVAEARAFMYVLGKGRYLRERGTGSK